MIIETMVMMMMATVSSVMMNVTIDRVNVDHRSMMDRILKRLSLDAFDDTVR